MDFAEAEASFRTLENQLNARQIDLKWYQTALSQIRVTDAQGYVWMMQERTGAWHYWNGQQWVPGTPTRTAAPPPASVPPAPVVPTTPTSYSPPAYSQPAGKAKPTPAPGSSGRSKSSYFLQWFVGTALGLVLIWFLVPYDARGFVLLVAIGSSIVYLVRIIAATRKM